MATTSISASNLRIRRSFAKNRQVIEIPNLIELQKRSYEEFLQKDVDPDKRENVGLQAVFKSVFPISDFNNTASLEFVSYALETPKYDVDECRQRGMTFAAPIKVTLRLIVFEVNEQAQTRSIRDVKEQEVYLGEIPLMTANGSFIINGTERVVVSQLHRSPGVFFDHDSGKNHASGKLIYSARVIPYRGSWLDFEFDHKDLIYCRIDRRRKLPATVLVESSWVIALKSSLKCITTLRRSTLKKKVTSAHLILKTWLVNERLQILLILKPEKSLLKKAVV